MLGYRSDEWIVYNKKTCCNESIGINFLLFLNIISSSWSKTIFINYLTRCWGKKSSLRSCLVFGFVFIFLVFIWKPHRAKIETSEALQLPSFPRYSPSWGVRWYPFIFLLRISYGLPMLLISSKQQEKTCPPTFDFVIQLALTSATEIMSCSGLS